MLPPLSIELFLTAGEDREGAQYRILAALSAHRRALEQRRLFPTWQQAQSLRQSLEHLLQQFHAIEEALPHVLIGINWAELRLETLPAYVPSERERFLHQLRELAEWALPEVEQLCLSGQELYEFAAEHIAVHEIGLLRLQSSQGFLLIPDRLRRQLLICRYHALPVFGADQHRIVQLHPVTTLPIGTIWAPEVWRDIAQETLPEHQGTTYLCEADVDFPLQETLLPIAEQKLARRLTAA